MELSGFGHNIQMGQIVIIYLFASRKVRLPTWFVKYPWGDELNFKNLNIFQSQPDIGLIDYYMSGYAIKAWGSSLRLTLSPQITPVPSPGATPVKYASLLIGMNFTRQAGQH